ncbi:MAG: GNAT family N-acetyltransferase [Bacteroidales bacterium]|nr:GNAT family N-acetyltransferase [Bacteroidales bacterium]
MDQVRIHQIKNPNDQYYAEFWRIYSESFPLNERRISGQQSDIFNKSNYYLNTFIAGNQFVGFISFWTSMEFIFIEHLAIAPEFRNQGFGNTIFKSFIENNPIPVILEIEPPVDATSLNRLRFYKSLNFKLNEHNHYQPAYHVEDEPIPMNILSYPTEISDSKYQQFARFQKEIMMVKFS